MGKKWILCEITVLFLLSLTPFLWLTGGHILIGHDSGFRIDIASHMLHLFQTWNPTVNFGIDWSLYKGFLIIQAPEYIAQTLFGSLQSAEPFVLTFWFFTMAMGMYLAMRGFFPEKKYWFLRLYTSVFWVFNFYILQGWFIGERAKFSLYAALPLAVYIIVSTYQRRRPILYSAVLFGLLYFFCNGGSSPPLYGATLIVWSLLFGLYSLFEIRKFHVQGVLFSIKVIFSFGISFLLFNAYWIVSQIGLLLGSYSSAVADQGGIDGLLAWEREISKNSSFINLLRLEGIPDWYGAYHPYAAAFLHNPVLILFSFFPLGMLCFGLICIQRRIIHPPKLLTVVLFLTLAIGLFFSAGSHPPSGALYILFMKKVPGFAIFRSSFYKFAPLVWFAIIVLSGLFTSEILEKVSKKKRAVCSILILIGIVVYHYPYFSTQVFQFDPFFSTRVIVPSYVLETAKFLNSQKDTGRILILPRLDTGFINKPIDTYDWHYYSLDVLPRSASFRTFIANDSPEYIVQRLYNAIYTEDSQTVSELTHVLGISEILFRTDIKQSLQESSLYPITAVGQHVAQVFGKPIFTSGKWSVYPVASVQPMKTVTADIVAAIEPVLHESDLISSTAAVVRVSATQATSLTFPRLATEAECFYCAPNEYQQFSDSILLPPVPGKITAFIKRLRPTHNAVSLDALLSQSELMVQTADPSSFNALLQTIEQQWQQLNGRDRLLYAARLAAFLEKEREFTVQHTKTAEQQETTAFLTRLQKEQWVSDAQNYRLGISVPMDGTYQVITVPPNLSFQLNDVMIDPSKTSYVLKRGYYRVQVNRLKGQEIPHIFVETNGNPSQQSLFISSTAYDTRWKATTAGSNRALPHVLVNGYANGWILNGIDPRQVKLEYLPQKIFYLGLIISGISLSIGVLFLIKQRKYL